MVYIDADHSYEAVKADIDAWMPHVRDGGILAGHDYGGKMFPGVTRAVQQRFADRTLFGWQLNIEGNIWWVKIDRATEDKPYLTGTSHLHV